MTEEEIKEIIRRSNDEKNRDEKILPTPKRAWVFLGPLLALSGILVGVAVRKEYRDRQRDEAQAVTDAATDARLIAVKDGVMPRGYYTLMFFDLDGRTNTAEAVSYFGTVDPNTLEGIRHLKLGSVKKVGEWKKF